MPIWNSVVLANLLKAMNRIDFIGISNARGGHFGPAGDLHMCFNGRGPYEARPLIAWAYNDQNPGAPFLSPADFLGNDAHDFLEAHGFAIVPIGVPC